MSVEIISLRYTISKMNNLDLVDEIYEMYIYDDRADDIIIDYYSVEQLHKEDREYLINFYINARSTIGLHLDKIGE
jgi:hypothetical protein